MKGNMARAFLKPLAKAKSNSSTILSVLSVIGLAGTVIMAVRDTKKAIEIIQEEEKEKGEPLTKKEMVIAAAPEYIPTLTFGAATAAGIIGSNAISLKKRASLTSAYLIANQKYEDYRRKTKNVVGEKTEKIISNSLEEDIYKDAMLKTNSNPVLFFDEMSQRYFEKSVEDVILAEYFINRDLANNEFSSLNDFYTLLDIPEINDGDEIGWSLWQGQVSYGYNWIDFDHVKMRRGDGREYYLLTYPTRPTEDFLATVE